MAALVGQTIAVVNKSGKVVSTSKQVMNVFKEAKTAYRERKAEIIAERNAEKMEKAARRDMAAISINDDTPSSHSSHRRSHSQGLKLKVRPPTQRHSSSSSRRSSASASPVSPRHRQFYEQDLHSQPSHQTPAEYCSAPRSPMGRPSTDLVRRATDQELAVVPDRPPRPTRSSSASAIDMDLAYGEYHPESLVSTQQRTAEDPELKGLVAKVKMLLDEANCAQHSVSAMIAHLQKNPDAMAAVALTLAEISNIVARMAPGALAALKGGAPAVFALLAAPEFLIAAGVGVGITVVMLGGYKIIKKIKTKQALEKEGSVDEMMEVTTDLDRIEQWRRGIADVEASSPGTSVEGELITPMAASMRAVPVSNRVGDLKAKKKKQRKKSKSEKDAESEKSSTKSGKSSKADSLVGGDGKQVVKVKKPSPLRMMFK